MCLVYDKGETSAIEELLKKSPSNTKIFYKVYEVKTWKNQTGSGFHLHSVYFNKRKPIKGPGYVVSNRNQKELLAYEREIYEGIHVHERKHSTIADVDYAKVCHGRIVVVIPVVCSLKDHVASGFYGNYNSSVFMKIKITEQTWSKLQKQFLKG